MEIRKDFHIDVICYGLQENPTIFICTLRVSSSMMLLDIAGMIVVINL